MGTLVLAGATSGSTTLTPADTVTTVLTLPSSTATLATLGANTFTGNQSITGTLGVTGTSTLAAINASGKITSTVGNTSIVLENLSATTGYQYMRLVSTGASALFGIDTSAGGSLGTGTAPYSTVLSTQNATSLHLVSNGVVGLTLASGGAVTIPGTLGVTGTITPGQTTGIVGTTTNNNVQAGSVGEFVSSSPASYTVTSSASNMTSISLTAGDWDVSAQAGSAGISVGTWSMRLCISSASAAFTHFNSGAFGQGDQVFPVDATNGIGSAAIPPIRLSLASTTTVYLVTLRYGGSNFAANGIISARRVR